TLVHVGSREALSGKARAELKAAGVRVVEGSIPAVAIEKRRTTAFDFGTGEPCRFDVVYSALGVTPRSQLAVQAGAKL
ncbi:hypothetical protein, partial [Staphylococcus aureus]|uniref:hypothetical protein n=1 Tax=Staphylococcus aureus TaxID=1280 RepID=UPI001E341B56